ncbi:mucin-6-like [Spinachia spinachia]
MKSSPYISTALSAVTLDKENELACHTQIYWVSSMFVQVQTTCGLNFQVQLYPEIQLFIDPPDTSNDKIKGLCGNSNSDTTYDFTTNSGIIENSAEPFALSWSLGNCRENIPTTCANRENDCRNGKVCVSCSEGRHKRLQKTCDYISKPKGTIETCKSGCYCPDHTYEDHHGNCVSLDECTCVFSGKAFSAGQQVNSNCKTCTCYRGQWHCIEKPCRGQCQVYGNGHYQTFDSKWFRFSGQCLYTLVQNSCGNVKGTFSIRVESVPCCEEVLTCSRNIILQLKVHFCRCENGGINCGNYQLY